MNRVVIVEDEKMIRQGICAMLLKSGIVIKEVIECKNGIEALEVIARKHVDILITDIRMPKMDGITLVKEVAKLEHLPKVIVISGYDDFSYAVELLRNGAREYLLKPIERTRFITTLRMLEEEIKAEVLEKEKQQQKAKFLFYKHLKLFLNTLSPEHFEMLKVEGETYFNEKRYWVYCVQHPLKEIRIQGVMHLKDIKGQDLFILLDESSKESLEALLAQTCFGVSMAHQGINQLEAAYLEALHTRKKAFWMCRGDKNTLDELTYQKHFINMNNMTQLIGTNRFYEVTKFLELFKCKVQRGEIELATFEKVIQTFLNQIRETYLNIIDEQQYSRLESIYTYTNIETYIKGLGEFLLQLHKVIIEELDDYKSKQKIQEAVMYIQTHYHKDLNMAIVSNHVSMNYSLFSVLFKKYTGKNFITYLKELRMKEAKRLLAETDKKVNEISMLVGYENEKYFMKAFKTLYAVSPSEYRKNVQIGKVRNLNL